MGQRLVINIYKGDRLVANAYYHWSAYTLPSIELMRDIIDNGRKEIDKLNKPNISKSDEITAAINLLSYTGASLTEDKQHLSEYGVNKADLLPGAFADPDRNNGLIAFTESEMSHLDSLAEGLIHVYVDKGTFNMCWMINSYDTTDSEYKDELKWRIASNFDINEDNIDDDEIPTFIDLLMEDLEACSIDFENIDFDQVGEVNDWLCSHESFTDENRKMVYTIIE